MAESSNIAWTRSTFNPWIGCTKVGPGCDHCYASVSTPARAMGIQWGAGQPRRRTSEANWRQPLRWNQQAERTGERWLVFFTHDTKIVAAEIAKDAAGKFGTAAARPDGYCCPTRGLRGAAQEAVLRALRAQGMITTEPGPRITDKGRSELAAEAAR